MKKTFPKWKTIRIPQYDYSQEGCYFITICTKNREKILSKIVGVGIPDDPLNQYTENQLKNNNEYKIKLKKFGIIVEKYINSINKTYKNMRIDNYVIMPNHIHMICVLEKNKSGSSRTPTPTNARIPFLISTFKRLINRECKEILWQRNYYEHIIRNEKEYLRILEYIENNPLNWIYDKYY